MVMERGYGKYIVTGTRLGILLDHVIAVDKKYSGAFDRKKFTEVIGASPTSNGPAEKLKDMVDFGLLSKDNQSYAISELGRKSIHGDKVERVAAIDRIIRKIPLWDLLLKTIGQNPDRETFVKAINQILRPEEVPSTKNLDRLWHAYMEDISCITKTPPYSRGSALLGKQKQPKVQLKKTTKPSGETVVRSKMLNDQDQVVCTPKDRPSLVGRFPFTKITLEVGGVRFEVKDLSSITVARFLINALEDELSRGDDNEQ